MSALESDDDLICPSCGGFCESETPTGWCTKCTILHGYCIGCGRKNTSPRQYECWHCRDGKWRIKNADAIEAYQMQGLSLTAAMDQVRIDNRAKSSCVRYSIIRLLKSKVCANYGSDGPQSVLYLTELRLVFQTEAQARSQLAVAQL